MARAQSQAPVAALARVTVQSEGRRLDVTVPTQVPLVEVMPGFVRSLTEQEKALRELPA